MAKGWKEKLKIGTFMQIAFGAFCLGFFYGLGQMVWKLLDYYTLSLVVTQ